MKMDQMLCVINGGDEVVSESLAKSLLEQGARVVRIDPGRTDGLTEVEEGHYRIKCVLENAESTKEAFGIINQDLGEIHVVINASGGVIEGKSVEESSMNQWRNMLSTNFISTLNSCQAVLPIMQQQKFGRIINFGGKSGEDGLAMGAPYAVSKGAVHVLTKSITLENKAQNIYACALMPEMIDSPQNREQMPNADWSSWIKPEDIAGVIAGMLSDDKIKTAAESDNLLVPVDSNAIGAEGAEDDILSVFDQEDKDSEAATEAPREKIEPAVKLYESFDDEPEAEKPEVAEEETDETADDENVDWPDLLKNSSSVESVEDAEASVSKDKESLEQDSVEEDEELAEKQSRDDEFFDSEQLVDTEKGKKKAAKAEAVGDLNGEKGINWEEVASEKKVKSDDEETVEITDDEPEEEGGPQDNIDEMMDQFSQDMEGRLDEEETLEEDAEAVEAEEPEQEMEIGLEEDGDMEVELDEEAAEDDIHADWKPEEETVKDDIHADWKPEEETTKDDIHADWEPEEDAEAEESDGLELGFEEQASEDGLEFSDDYQPDLVTEPSFEDKYSEEDMEVYDSGDEEPQKKGLLLKILIPSAAIIVAGILAIAFLDLPFLGGDEPELEGIAAELHSLQAGTQTEEPTQDVSTPTEEEISSDWIDDVEEEPISSEPEVVEEPVTAPVEEPVVEPEPEPEPEITARGAFLQHNYSEAGRLWLEEKRLIPARYTVVLLFACQEQTIENAFESLNQSEDFFIIPREREEKTCYFVCLGDFVTSAEGQTILDNVPERFKSSRSKPRIRQLDKIVN